MLRNAWLWGVSVGLAGSVLAASLVIAQEAPPRLRGTLDQVSGNALTIKARNGTSTTVQLKADAKVIAVEKGTMSDIKDNSFVGITALAQPGGAIKAVEVHVFAEPLRGIGEGHYPWDLMPNSTMTNAAVTQQVKKVEGNTLSLKYKDGEKMIVVPSDAPIVNLVPGDKADLKPGTKIFIPAWAKKADGSWEAAVVLVGRDGIIPPM
jgi:outer membrane lipoprotein SlyB